VDSLQPAIFLDRDGVIIENRKDYVRFWSDVSVLPGAVEACQAVVQADIPLVLISNQALVGRGIMNLADVTDLNDRILKLFADQGATFTAAYLCPHHPNDNCECRKPKPGMLLQAAKEYQLDLARSIFIGDNLTDMQAAEAAGVKGIFIRTGLGAEQEDQLHTLKTNPPVYDDLADAIRQVLAGFGKTG
jgi:D-glycero-D-manno-heptose 1,7-bisphosphate phosphatase